MSERLISSVHIQKLGHKIQEIRERALLNIISKLNRGFIYDNDLARSRQMLTALFEWFSFDSCTYQEEVLKLMNSILKSSCGEIIIKHYNSKSILSDLKKIRSIIDPKHYSLIDEMLETTHGYFHRTIEVPPLTSDIPLSYRSYESAQQVIESTATTIEGFVEQSSSSEQQTGKATPKADIDEVLVANFNFKWQPLIASDRHVLESVEEALRNPLEPMELLNSCDFFSDVILQDFPAEIFLQRPSIVLEYLRTSVSKRLTNSILNCLCKLTDNLIVGMHYYSDPSMFNSKEFLDQTYSINNAPVAYRNLSSSYIHNYKTNNSKLDKENRATLEPLQLFLPQYCFKTIQCLLDYLNPENRSSNNQTISGINSSLKLLDKLMHLLSLCISPGIWEKNGNILVLDVLRKFEETLKKFAESLEYFRLETISNDCDITNRIIYLRLLDSCANLLVKLIPMNKTDTILPPALKTSLMNVLLDPVLAWLYPGLHETILQFVTKFGKSSQNDSLDKYKQVKNVCKSIKAAVKLLRCSRTLLPVEAFQLASEGLLSLEFHNNTKYISIIIELCANKLHECKAFDVAEECILSLLAHNNLNIQEETYLLCSNKVLAAVGPKFNTSKMGIPGYQILFLLKASILIEICLHGINSKNEQIAKYAKNIVIHILKCKILVSEDIWNRIVQAMIKTLPVLICHAGKDSVLGCTIISFLDPDTAASQFMPPLEILKGNLRLLFIDGSLAREEAVSRLCWLLASQNNSRDLLPRLNTLQDKNLGDICRLQKIIDINKIRQLQHFYQPSTLFQVLELLSSANVDPIIRRSAVTQVSVMLEDHLLHQAFLENGGMKIVMDVMRNALTENCYMDYVDSIIPAVIILKNVCMFNATVRHELCNDIDVYFYVLRGLFIFHTEDRMRQDCSILLCLLLFNDFILGSSIKGDFSLPHLIVNKLSLPLTCNSHWVMSPHMLPALGVTLLSDQCCLNYIRIQFNSEWYNGLDSILKWDEVRYDESQLQFNETLKLSNGILINLKNSSLSYCIEKCLVNIQNGTSHNAVIECIHQLEGYVQLYSLVKQKSKISLKILMELPWDYSFSRILNAPPADTQDAQLLTAVIKFLAILVPHYFAIGESCWIIDILKSPSHYLPNLLQVESSPDLELKLLHKELLNLIIISAWQEQNHLDLYSITGPSDCTLKKQSSWRHIIGIIATNLKFSDNQHFYNLAYIDNLLSCAVHLTAVFGWRGNKQDLSLRDPIVGLISSLYELVSAFHCSKGSSAAVSLMGLNITRNVLLTLNHLLMEMQNMKDWEKYFLEEDIIEENILRILCALWLSRDVVVRAAILQLLTGLVMSSRLAIELVKEIKDTKTGKGIWETTLSIFLDNEEASIVRENAIKLLSNLICHTESCGDDNLTLISGVMPNTIKKNEDPNNAVYNLLEEYDFFKNLRIVLTCPYMKSSVFITEKNLNKETERTTTYIQDNCDRIFTRNILPDLTGRSISSRNTNTNDIIPIMVVTPSFVKTLAIFTKNLVALMPYKITNALQESGSLKMFFRCLLSPPIDINTTKELSFYCDILEMNIAICSLLSQVVKSSDVCFITILHTRDCLTISLSLLNPALYSLSFPQLHYLRNQLWMEVFNFIEAILNSRQNESQRSEALSIISTVLCQCGHQQFLQTICEAISCSSSADLQESALICLIALLQIESNKTTSYHSSLLSMQDLLDNTRAPSTRLSIEENVETIDIENVDPEKQNTQYVQSKSDSKKNVKVLEAVYFGKVTEKLNKFNKSQNIQNVQQTTEGASKSLMAGAEICRILLQLFEISSVRTNASKQIKKRMIITNALTSILCISCEAKTFALKERFVDTIIKQFKDLYMRLSLESVDCLKRAKDKKRVCPVLKELTALIGLITNFMLEYENVKEAASLLGFSDIIHKLWVWFCIDRPLLCDALKMLCTYTTDCTAACHSLPLTSSIPGSGPRKTPNNLSLLHELITLVSREMDSISKTHDLTNLELIFHVLCNTCATVECRIIVVKSNLLHLLPRLHPANTKRQRPWDNVELIWLEFLLTFTGHPEGQAHVAKTVEAFELIILLASSPKLANKKVALSVLRNIAFYQPNRPRLLNSGDFINVIQSKLTNGSVEEMQIVVTIIWALAANNQRGKIILKCAGLDVKLQELVKRYSMLPSSEYNFELMDLMLIVLGLLKDSEKSR